MKRYILLLITLTIILLTFTGCESVEEKQRKQIEAQVSELIIQADNYFIKGDFDNTIAIYEKILNLKEDEQIRNKLTSIKTEQENVKKVKEYYTAISDMKYKLSTIFKMPDLSKMLIENKKVFDEIEDIDTSSNSEISLYVKDVINDVSYKNLKSYYSEKYIQQAELDSNNSKTLDALSGSIEFSLIDSTLFDTVKTNIDLFLGVLTNKKLPEKYK